MNNSPRKAKRIVLPFSPFSNTRHRCTCIPGYTSARTYTPAEYRAWKDNVAADIAARPLGPPIEGPVSLWARFAVHKPKSTKLKYPKPDIDNYEKALFDALVQAGNVITDDYLIVSNTTEKVWTDTDGGIVVQITELSDSFYL